MSCMNCNAWLLYLTHIYFAGCASKTCSFSRDVCICVNFPASLNYVELGINTRKSPKTIRSQKTQYEYRIVVGLKSINMTLKSTQTVLGTIGDKHLDRNQNA